jgi:hypothetical protein
LSDDFTATLLVLDESELEVDVVDTCEDVDVDVNVECAEENIEVDGEDG